MTVRILQGDVREKLAEMPDASFDCIVTSPPYWGLRDYGVVGQIGLEPTLTEYLDTMVAVGRDLRRVLKPSGTFWLNIGDSYASAWVCNRRNMIGSGSLESGKREGRPNRLVNGLKEKDLCMVPNRLAIRLQEPWYDGKITNIEDRIWLAAMIDAEGCMFIHKRKIGQSNGQGYERKSDTYSTGLEIANTSEAIVNRCLAIVGQGSICSQSPDQNNRRKQTIFRWNLCSNECRNVIREIYPHLVAKQHQARILLGCPPSGPNAEAAHEALIGLHNGAATAIDFPPPESCFSPGWYVRSEIIWKKPNPMPESVTDRPTSSHEKIWLLTKSERYFYDADAIAEPAIYSGLANQDASGFKDPRSFNGKHKAGYRTDKQRGHSRRRAGFNDRWDAMERAEQCSGERNARNVWTIATKPYSEAHFATFPPELAERCIKAGCPAGGTVLDPFGGAGTTGMVADRLGRDATLIELNPAYVEIARERFRADAGMFAEMELA